MTPLPSTKTEQTRHQIVEAAHTLFVRQGYHGTSMRQIARQAGIALGGIYNHFANKEKIFEAVFIEHHPYQRIIPAVMAARGETVEELLRDIARRMIESLNQTPEFLNLLFVDLVEFQSMHTRVLVEKNIANFLGVYQRVIELGKSGIRPIPPLILARSFFSMFFSYFITGIIIRSGSENLAALDENAFDHFVEIYLHGILLPPDKSS